MKKKLNRFLKNVLDNVKISKDEYDDVCSKGSTPGILYGNPEIHELVVKNLPKFRPILSTINNSGYNVAKFLIPILEPLSRNEFTINPLNSSFSLI